MIARVLRVDVPRDRIDGVVEAYRADVRPIHAGASGLRQHYVLVDWELGRIEIIGVWDSAEAVNEIAAELEPPAVGCGPRLVRIQHSRSM